MNYKVLQNKYGKAKKKQSQLPIGNYSLSTWKDYKDWIAEKNAKENVSNRSKSLKGTDTKAKAKKTNSKPQKSRNGKQEYKKQLEHPLWLKKRQVILKRDNYKCALCCAEFNLCVHHTKYIEGKKAWEYPNSTLITLCKDCHKKVHSDKNNELNPYKKNETN